MWKVIFLICSAYLIIVVFFYFFQRSMIYLPDQYFPSPEAAGVPQMNVASLPTQDGLVLHAWYRAPSEPRLPTLVYFHGNAGSIADRAMIVKPFLDEGYGVLLMTYRGYSGNPGKPDEQGLYQDARAAMNFLHEKGVQDRCIVLYGNSIGAAVAVQIAAEYPVALVILQAPFTSLADVGKTHYPFFPVKWLVKDQFDSIAKAGNIAAPVLIIHGENDTIIPPALSHQLFLAFSEPKQIIAISNRGHNDLNEPGLIMQFIREHVNCYP
ncbi:MAG: alpha/beta hydrolase [Waddliaceae bacterium]